MNTSPPTHASAHQARVALEVLERVQHQVREACPADQTLADLFHQHREFGSRDRRFYSNLVFSVFRWKGWTDLAPSAPLAVRAAAAYRLDCPESHPAVDVLAPLDAPAEPLDSLPAKARQLARWLLLPSAPFPGQLVPAPLLPLLAIPAGNPGTLDPVLESFQLRPPTWLRIRAECEAAVRGICDDLSIAPVPHPRLPLAWQAPDPARLAALLAAARGRLEIQDVASQAVGLMAGVEAGGDWWDVCAGAGGKSLHLADRAQGRLHLLATDVRQSALAEAAKRIRQAGQDRRIHLRRLDATRDSLPAKRFDGVLVDAPCSGTGTWSRNPDARWRTPPDQPAACADTQSTILMRVADSVKPGGTLVYATCSLTRQENTGVLDRFLESRSDFKLAPFPNPLTGKPTPGWTYFWPWEGPGSGMFAARLVRSTADPLNREPLNPLPESFPTP